MDPLERKYVYLANGSHGDGLFAKKDLKNGLIVSYYAGTLQPRSDVNWQNMSMDEKLDFHKNLLYITDDLNPGLPKQLMYINVPKPFWDLAKFRATLGHKVNHSFVKGNVEFKTGLHPRFGLIRMFKTARKIKRGEELLTNYGYNIQGNVPQWYKDAYNLEIGAVHYGQKNVKGSFVFKP